MQARSNHGGFGGYEAGYDNGSEDVEIPLDGYAPASARHVSGYAPAHPLAPSGYAPAAAPASGHERVVPVAAPPARSRLDDPEWLVHVDGGPVVGPVSASQIARGIRAGRVPADASLQRAGDVFWSSVLDELDVIAALKSI